MIAAVTRNQLRESRDDFSIANNEEWDDLPPLIARHTSEDVRDTHEKSRSGDDGSVWRQEMGGNLLYCKQQQVVVW